MPLTSQPLCKIASTSHQSARSSPPSATGELYALETATPYPEREPDPGSRVRYPPNAQDIARRNAENSFNVKYKDHHDENTMDRALIDRFYDMLGEYAEDVRDEAALIVKPTFLQIYELATKDWGATTPQQRDANLASISAEWHENDGMKLLFRRVKAAITYSVTCGHRIPDNMIVDKVLIVICRTQAYKQQYLAFKQLEVQNYAALMKHFKQAERDRIECEDAAAQHGYGMNAEENGDDAMSKHLENLANAITANEVAHNAHEAATTAQNDGNDILRQLTANIENMQQQLMATQQMQQQMAANMQQQQSQPPTHQQPHRQYFQGNATNASNVYRQSFGNMNTHPQIQTPMQHSQPFPHQSFPSHNMQSGPGNFRNFAKNPIKRFENLNYCHSCGFDISMHHTSANCPKPGPNHQFNATRNNTMNGSRKGAHKTVMPSAAGKVCQDVLTQQRKARKASNRPAGQMNGYQQPNNGFQQGQQYQQRGNCTSQNQRQFGNVPMSGGSYPNQQHGWGQNTFM